MRKLSFWAGLAILSFGLGGCETLSSLPFLGGGTQDAGDVSTAPVPVAPNTVPANPSAGSPPNGQDPNAPEGEDPEFEDPVVAGEDAELPTPDGLIPLTNRDTAIKILAQNQGRANPFATIPLSAQAANTLAVSEQAPRPKLPAFPSRPASPLAQERSEPFPASSSSTEPPEIQPPKLPVFPIPPPPPQARGSQPSVPQAPSDTPLEWTGEDGEGGEETPFNPEALPSLPEPTIAKELTVTGVVNLGDNVKAIVQDSEGKSRYVSPGEYLGSGQVLVKRIEMNRGPQPVVVFEELGMEVIRAVGEPPTENTNA